MKKLLSQAFWDYALERAIKTAAQAALAVLGSASLGVIDTDWAGVGSAALMGAVASLLTSLSTFSEE
jgi:hypothetical protein